MHTDTSNFSKKKGGGIKKQKDTEEFLGQDPKNPK